MLGTVTKALELDFCFEESYCNCSANYHGLKKLLQLFSKLPWFEKVIAIVQQITMA